MGKKLTALFLGAGASFEAGMPLVWELTEEIKRWLTLEKLIELNSGWNKQRTGMPDAVVQDLGQMLARSDVHYESILGYLETQYLRSGTNKASYHHLFVWMIELVYQILYYRHIQNSDRINNWLKYFDGLAVLAEKNSPLWVFSLNHDLVVEAIADRLGFKINCGYGPETALFPRRNPNGDIIGVLTAEVLREAQIDLENMNFSRNDSLTINLVKLHGSLDMFTFRDGKDMVRFLPLASGAAAQFEMLRYINEELIFILPSAPGGKARVTNEIAYADNMGEMQFLRRTLLSGAYKFDERRSQVLPKNLLKQLSINLNFISNLICIGYGFCDLHINKIVRQWLQDDADRRLEIVNPSATQIPADFLHLANQIVLVKSAATDYFDMIGGINRSATELNEKEIFRRMRAMNDARRKDLLKQFRIRNDRQIMEGLASRLEALGPTRVGELLKSAGSPQDFSKRLVMEVGLPPEELTNQFLEFLKKYERS